MIRRTKKYPKLFTMRISWTLLNRLKQVAHVLDLPVSEYARRILEETVCGKRAKVHVEDKD